MLKFWWLSMQKQKFYSKFWLLLLDISINITLFFAYIHDNPKSYAWIASTVYVSNTVPIGFAINGCFDEFLDSFCKLRFIDVLWKIQTKTTEKQWLRTYYMWLIIIIVSTRRTVVKTNSHCNIHLWWACEMFVMLICNQDVSKRLKRVQVLYNSILLVTINIWSM